MLESQRLRAREGAEPNDGGESLSLGGRSEEHRRLKFASLLKGVVAPMPNQEALVPMWFEDIEATLESYDVPAEWWAGLVLPQLSERARGLLCRLKAEERKVYAKLKSSILDGLRLTAAECKRLFMGSRKGEKESWDQFAVRLENYFDYYVQSSKVRTFEELEQLAVTDRLKECLSPEARAHVVLNEHEAFLSPSSRGRRRGTPSTETDDNHQLTTASLGQRSKASPPHSEEEERTARLIQAVTKRYSLRGRERHSSEMNGDEAENLQVLGVADSDAGGQRSGTSDTASEQQLALLQLQLKIAEAETENQRLRAREGAEPNDGGESLSLGGRPEEHRRLKFASLLKGVVAPMPNQEALVPMWFEDIEATLESYDVPAEWWAGLVLPQLSERARGLLCRLKAEERKVYAKLKSSILDGLRLTAAECKRLFMGSRKGEKESWDQFAVRLENYFDYYVQSSKVRTFEELEQLAVTDRLKECLSPEARAHRRG
ncbi:hypothetical protein HPB50_008132 [Hyalomma asiaticum]|uniref:Uncharacterized protein n=1 Tax=Hyalomma asiaticum TaxID=266040 RepID=A0ACB7TCX5_HYAAI|nr:hypothetical protein HPB50_008132 [Hyalomma asiaticum]